MRKSTRFAAAALVAALPLTDAALAGSIDVHDPWARASAGMARAGAAFMGLRNEGEMPDRLVAASAEVSKSVELHTHIKDGDVMKMRRVDGIDLPVGGTVMLEPGGFHIMFMGLKAPLKQGSSFPLTLTFRKSGPVTVDIPVKAVGAMGPKHGKGPLKTQDHGKMKMDAQ